MTFTLGAETRPLAHAPIRADENTIRQSASGDFVLSEVAQAQFLRRRRADLAVRALDLVCASGLIIIVSPLLLVVAIAIRATSSGPVLFKQSRHGLFGKRFTIFKFRTMQVSHDGAAQTARNDPRITSIGAFLRRTSIDELPQLFNVLRGEMSLVGPRPMPTQLDLDLAARNDEYEIRFFVRPGLTGLAQVNGFRGAVVTARDLIMRVRLDNYWVRRRTARLFVAILVSTAMVFLSQENAV